MEARMETELEIYERLSRDLKEIEDQVAPLPKRFAPSWKSQRAIVPKHG
jgi:hypothetical protein